VTTSTTSKPRETTEAPSFTPDCKLASIVTRHIPPSTPARVLDVECGHGDRCYTIARALPAADITGIDRDESDVKRALSRRGSEEGGKRVAFVRGDYLGFRRDPVDLVVADAGLESLEGVAKNQSRRDALFAKISRDLAPEGLLILTLPNESIINRALWLVRGTIGEKIRFRGETLASRIPEATLRDGEALRTFLRAVCDLDFVADYPLAPSNPCGLRLSSAVFRKRPEK